MPAERHMWKSAFTNIFSFDVIMRWLLAGCFGLALINISVALNRDVPISQKPRFYGLNARRNVSIAIYCLCSKELQPAIAEWYKVDEYDGVVDQNTNGITEKNKYELLDGFGGENVTLVIHDVRLNDSGVYFCKIKDTLGPGTAVQVARSGGGVDQARRSKMKDALIILQALLLAVCIAAVLLRKRQQLEKKDSIYEEPEVDHIYEGLAIETCSGGVYEELSVYAQADGADSAEAPWE